MVEKLLLRPQEAGELIGVSRAQAYQMIARGELPSVRLGKSISVPLDKLREHIEQLAEQQTCPEAA